MYAAMDYRYQYTVVFVFIVVLIVIVAVLFMPAFLPGSSSDGIKQLAAVEVRSYQGKDLSSITDFS
jgi:hypothetical protein